MKDVARQAGVSLSTVSYVVNDRGLVAPERRARVLEACRLLNYTPNGAARKLRGRFASTIGLVVPDLANQFFAFLAEGVERAASERDVLVVLCAPEAAGMSDSVNARLLRSQRLDGVVYLAGESAPALSLMELIRLGPVVLVDEQIPGFELPSVVSDNRRGAREIAQHVIEQGHERAAIIGGPSALWTAQQRLAGYREAFAAAGRDPDEVPVLVGDYHQSSGTELAKQLLSRDRHRRPTALVCANDLMAVGALEYARSVGLRVPEDFSLVGFDDLPFSALLQPRLTTVRQPARDMGYRAATMLLDLIDKDEPGEPESFPVTVQLRDSVAPPPRDHG
jgi:LacI family transcriptional regulator